MKKTIFITIFVLMLAIGLVSADLDVNPTSREMKFDHLEQDAKTISFEIENKWDNHNMSIEIILMSDDLNHNLFDFQEDILLKNKTIKTFNITVDINDLKTQINFEGFNDEIIFKINYKNETNSSINGSETFTLNLEIPEYKKELTVVPNKVEFKDKDPGESFERTITLENTGTVTLEDIEAEFTNNNFIGKFNLEHTLNKDTLKPEEKIEFEIKGKIPDELGQDLSDKGELSITTNEIEKKVDIEISSSVMVIDRIEVRADGRRIERILREDYLRSSSKYKISDDITLGQEIELIIHIKNNLPTDDRDNELRDIEIELFSSFILDADGLEGYISRIRPGRTEEVTLSFYLDPRDLYAGDTPYDLDISVIGEDLDRKNIFRDFWELEIELDRRSNPLLIYDLIKTPQPVRAGENLRIEFDLFNIGISDLRRTGIHFFSSELGIDEWIREFEIYEDERRTISRNFNIPNDLQTGLYDLRIIAYPSQTSSRDSTTKSLIIEVEDIRDETTTTTIPTTTTTTVQETTTTTLRQVIGSDAGVIPAEPRRDNEQLYVILLIVLIGIIILAVGGMIGYLFKKK